MGSTNIEKGKELSPHLPFAWWLPNISTLWRNGKCVFGCFVLDWEGGWKGEERGENMKSC